MALQAENYDPALKYGAVVNSTNDIAIDEGEVLIGASTGLATTLDVSGDAKILVGNGTTATSVAMSGDATIAKTGALTIGNNTISSANVVEATGTGGLLVSKSAIVVYDFSVDGGSQGAIALTGSPLLLDNSVVWVDAIEVVTTFTSSSDAATVTLGVPTDGDLFTAVAISDASNSWDQGIFLQGQGAIVVASQTAKKLTDARLLQLTVAGGEDLTAGKAIFHLRYYVSE